MTFSEYFNALYPYLSFGEKWDVFFDEMIGHFIFEDAQEACELLNCRNDTKRRYVKTSNPNKINPDYAKYVYGKHNYQGYRDWLHEKMQKQDTFDRVESWLSENGIDFYDVCVTCDELLEKIFLYLATPNASEGDEIQLPEKSPVEEADSQHLTETDSKLLKEFCIDFDNILEKCIASDPSEVWFTGRLAVKINSLYNDKWKNKLTEFEDIGLQSDILGTISTLQNFCKALDPDSESVPGSSVRRLRIKLRDNYVKLHPDNYAGMYPYDAFIDDWNDENDFEM